MTFYEIFHTLFTAKAILIALQCASIVLKVALLVVGISLLKIFKSFNKFTQR